MLRNILFSHKWPSLLALALFLLAATYLVWPRPSAPAHATLQQSTAGDWPMYMHTIERNSYNKTERLINATSAPTLTEKWAAPSPKGTGGLVFSQPVVANGVAYWGSFNGYEHATNVATGKDVWAIPPYLGSATTCAPMSPLGVVSSAAVATVSINNVSTSVAYVGGGDDYLYALNTADGSTLWRTLLDPSGPNTFIWDSPVVFHNTVYIGTATTGEAANCPLVVGKLFALNAATGAIEHKFIGVPSNCVGGGIWSSPTIDPSDGSIYLTIGTKQAKCTADTISLGIIKLRASDLKLLSSWQIPLIQRTTSDADFAGTPTLFTATLSDGLVHKLVGAVDKNGYFYAFDRSNLAATNPVWSTQISTEPGPCPQCGQGSISSAVWDGGNNLYVAGGTYGTCGGSLQDLDPVTGTSKWQDCLPKTVLGSLTLVPGVIALIDGSTLSLFSAKQAGSALFTNDIDKFYGSPSISNGVLYAGSKSGHLYAFSPTP